MGLTEAARFCLAGAAVSLAQPLSLPSEPQATLHNTLEKKISGSEMVGAREVWTNSPTFLLGSKTVHKRLMAQKGLPALLQGKRLAVSPAPGGALQRRDPGTPSWQNSLLKRGWPWAYPESR